MRAPERTEDDTDDNHRAVEAVRKALHDQKLPTTRYCPHTATWDGRYYTCTQDHHEGRTHEMRAPDGTLMATWVSPRLFVYELPEADDSAPVGSRVTNEFPAITEEDGPVPLWMTESESLGNLFMGVWVRGHEVAFFGSEEHMDGRSFKDDEIDAMERDALRVLAAIAEVRARREK